MSGQKLSLFDSAMIIMGSMIGSGIFIVSAEIAQQVTTPGMLLLAWVVTAIITILGALSYGELAAAMPKAGGQYIYLREAYNPLLGFLYGWTLFAVIQTGTIAAVAVAFAKYAGVLFPFISDSRYLLPIGGGWLSTQQLVAIVVIGFLTLYNFRDVKTGALLQNVFTFTKIAALLLMIALGLFFGISGMGNLANFSPAFPSAITLATIGVFGAAMTGSLFSADAWNNITYTAGEVENPQRNLPLSLIVGTSSVLGLYFLANITYLYVLPIDQIAQAEQGRVAALLMKTILGDSGKWFMAIMIMISTFGCLNGVILTGARVYYAMAHDGLFLRPAAQLNRNNVPANSLAMQGMWAALLTLSGSYSQLLSYIMFAVLVFYILTVAAVMVLRRTQPQLPRPYRTWGYPFVPIIYILLAAYVMTSILIYQFDFAVRGLVIILAGVPIYYLLARNTPKNSHNNAQ